MITVLAANQLSKRDINTVLLATCLDWIPAPHKLVLGGHVLTIYESSDKLTYTCNKFEAQGNSAVSFKTIIIDTGKEHGAFYIPHPKWVSALREWMNWEGKTGKQGSE